MSLSARDTHTQLEKLDTTMRLLEERYSGLTTKVHPSQQLSAVNLLHYLALRSQDTGKLQMALHEQGLSTLSGAEGYIRSQLHAVLQHFGPTEVVDFNHVRASRLLQERVAELFGGSAVTMPAIMVTFKTSFAHDFITVKKLLKAGMNIARINCAHDNEDTWLAMIKRVREASEFTGIPCKIYMDLAGPKIRTNIRGKKGRIPVDEEDILLLADDEKMKDALPVVGYTIPGIASQLKPGERVFFDDGVIETKVIGLRQNAAELEVVNVASKKPYLKTEKGINFPDSKLTLTALTDFDRQTLPFIMQHADMVGYSFVHNTPDLVALQNEMKGKKLPVIIKIETPEAWRTLPHLLFTAMQQPNFGIMIARGDLAVEIGFEQLSDAQDEILSICQAAHVPVVLATQILENLNKTGLATRAEITDASYGIMADCILINKGPHIVQTMKTLKKILMSKTDCYFKKMNIYRPSEAAIQFLNLPGGVTA